MNNMARSDIAFLIRSAVRKILDDNNGHASLNVLVMDAARAAVIEFALDKSGQNKTKAAKLLGIGRDQVRQRVEELGLDNRVRRVDEVFAALARKHKQ